VTSAQAYRLIGSRLRTIIIPCPGGPPAAGAGGKNLRVPRPG